MIEYYSPNTVVSGRPGIENVVPRRQVPNDDPPLPIKNSDGVPGHPQTANLHFRVDNQPWVTGLEVDDCDHLVPLPYSRRY